MTFKRARFEPGVAKESPQYLRSIPTKVPTVGQKRGVSGWGSACKCMKNLAPQVGFEPTTLRLTEQKQTYHQRLTRNGRQPDALVGNERGRLLWG
jgi:hypothetical protein